MATDTAQYRKAVSVIAGKKITVADPSTWGGFLTSFGVGPETKPDARENTMWQYAQDPEWLETLELTALIDTIATTSPDISKALWDFARFCNSGWEINAYKPGGKEQAKRAKAYLDEIVKQIDDMYGSASAHFDRLFIGAFLRGGMFVELVLDERFRFADLVILDPYVAQWKKIDDGVRGKRWQLGQRQGGKWVSLEVPTVTYIPIDPLPKEPFGRSMVLPAIYQSIFLLKLLKDMQRVVAQQGYPRLDIEVSTQDVLDMMPDLVSDPDAFTDFMDDLIEQVRQVYTTLEPDDAYIHSDLVKLNRPVGAIDASSLEGVSELIRLIERQVIRALKTMPLLFGLSDSTTEAHANRQWEITAAGIRNVQKMAETVLSRLFGLAVQAVGMRANVEVKFNVLRTSESMRDAQVELLKTRSSQEMYMAGWISQDEASIRVVGHPADQPEPREPQDAGGSGGSGGEANLIAQNVLQNTDEGTSSGGVS